MTRQVLSSTIGICCQGMQPVALDGHRYVVGIEARQHVQLEVGGDLATLCAVFSRLPGREAHVAMASTDEEHGWQQGPSSGAASTYRIRPLQPVDLDGISRVHWRACRIAYRFMSWSYTEDQVRHWYVVKLAEWDWGRVVCAEDTIVAYLAASGAHIDQLFVDPDHQRAGLGRALLTAMLERRLRPATVHVFGENRPARAFYERFGFREVDAWWDAQDQALNLLYKLE